MIEQESTINSENIDIEEMLSLLSDEEMSSENEATSSISRNPAVTWAKFILTDDMPNANKQRVPQEEFDNLISSGVFMPLKMAFNKINEGHEESYPLGVIAHLKKVGKKLIALAAIWSKERPKDVELIKEAKASGKPLNVSWEILYKYTKKNDTGGEDLLDTILRGVVIVGKPSYAGRTPILAIASEGSPAYLKQQSANTQQENLITEDKKLNELELANQKVLELTTALAEANSKVAALTQKTTDSDTELASLREYKAAIEKEEQASTRISEIKSMFAEAKIVKPETYFVENEDKLLSLDKGSLEFMLQDIVSGLVSASIKEDTASEHTNVPPIVVNTSSKTDTKEIAEGLKNLKKNKK